MIFELFGEFFVGHFEETLSSAEASLCCGEAGKKGKLREHVGEPCALSISSIIAIFIGIPSGRERSRKKWLR